MGIHCPKLHRVLASVHGFVAAPARALPGFSPRLNFGCRSGALRLGRVETCCPKLQRGLASVHRFVAAPARALPVFRRVLISVVAPARPGGNSLPETSSRPYFGA